MKVTISEVRDYQSEHGLLDTHVCYTDRYEFALAHTDEERDRRPAFNLRTCPVHEWLSSLEYPFADPGYYLILAPEVWRAV